MLGSKNSERPFWRLKLLTALSSANYVEVLFFLAFPDEWEFIIKESFAGSALRLQREVSRGLSVVCVPRNEQHRSYRDQTSGAVWGLCLLARRQRKQSLGSGSPVWFWEILTWGAHFPPTWVIVSLSMSWVDRIYQRFCFITCGHLTPNINLIVHFGPWHNMYLFRRGAWAF